MVEIQFVCIGTARLLVSSDQTIRIETSAQILIMKDSHLVLSFTMVLLVPTSYIHSIIFEMRRITQVNIHNLSKQYLPKVAKHDDKMLMVNIYSIVN